MSLMVIVKSTTKIGTTSSKFQFLSMDSNLHEQITKINKHSIDRTLKIHDLIA